MNEFFLFLAESYAPELIRLLISIVLGCIGFVAAWVYKRVGDNKIVIALADTVVKFVEQAYIALDGPAKLEKALDTLSAMLKKKHINVTREDLIVFIEAAVGDMNINKKKTPLVDVATADATRRVDETVEEIVKNVHEILGDTNDQSISDAAYDKGVNEGTM